MVAGRVVCRNRDPTLLKFLLAPTLAVVVFVASTGLPSKGAANGGTLIFEERVEEYLISVTVNPPTPVPGLILVGIIIKAVVSTNGDDHYSLVNVATELSVTATGPNAHVIGPLQPNPILPGISHFDFPLGIHQSGDWLLSLDLSGQLGNVTAAVPISVKADDVLSVQETVGQLSLTGWVTVILISLVAIAAILICIAIKQRGTIS